MDKQTTLDRLNEKVSYILQEYHTLKGENEMMKNEIVTLKADCELKKHEIERLDEENTLKDMEIEEIVNKIENILG